MTGQEALDLISGILLSHAEEDIDYNWDEQPYVSGTVDVVDGRIDELYPEAITTLNKDLNVLSILKKCFSDTKGLGLEFIGFYKIDETEYKTIKDWLQGEINHETRCRQFKNFKL